MLKNIRLRGNPIIEMDVLLGFGILTAFIAGIVIGRFTMAMQYAFMTKKDKPGNKSGVKLKKKT